MPAWRSSNGITRATQSRDDLMIWRHLFFIVFVPGCHFQVKRVLLICSSSPSCFCLSRAICELQRRGLIRNTGQTDGSYPILTGL